MSSLTEVVSRKFNICSSRPHFCLTQAKYTEWLVVNISDISEGNVNMQQHYLPLLYAIRLGVPSRQRPLHAGALRFPRWLLHVLSGPHGGQWRGERLSRDLRRDLQPLGQRAAYTRGWARSGGAARTSSQWCPLQRRRGGVGGGGDSIKGGPEGGLWKERAGFGQEETPSPERSAGAEQVRAERLAFVPGYHGTAVRAAAAAHRADRVRAGHCLPERHPQDSRIPTVSLWIFLPSAALVRL